MLQSISHKTIVTLQPDTYKSIINNYKTYAYEENLYSNCNGHHDH